LFDCLNKIDPWIQIIDIDENLIFGKASCKAIIQASSEVLAVIAPVIDEDLAAIATALKRNIRVIPVLVDDASMPRPTDLPDDLKLLLRRNAVEVSHTRFSTDSEKLITAIERVFEKIATEQREREEKARLEADRREAEENARLEAERRQREEQDRLETEQREREEKERLQGEEKERLAVERRETELKERLETERQQKEERDRLEIEQRSTLKPN
jgi:hypothetical protein